MFVPSLLYSYIIGLNTIVYIIFENKFDRKELLPHGESNSRPCTNCLAHESRMLHHYTKSLSKNLSSSFFYSIEAIPTYVYMS